MYKSTKILFIAFLIGQSSLIAIKVLWPTEMSWLTTFAPTLGVLGGFIVACIALSFVTGFWKWVFNCKNDNNG